MCARPRGNYLITLRMDPWLPAEIHRTAARTSYTLFGDSPIFPDFSLARCAICGGFRSLACSIF